MSKITLITICLSFLMLRGCGERPEECKQFLDLPRQQREEQFKSYPIEKQLDLYLCGMRVEPPQAGLAYDIADKGEPAIAVVVQRLRTSNDELDQEHLIYVLEVMSDRGLLRGRKDVIADISQVIDNMKISQMKQTSEERLKKIQINSGIKPFTYVP